MAQVIDGTWDEIKSHEADYAGHKLRLIIDPDLDDILSVVPRAPIVIRDRDHLIDVLCAGDSSPRHEVTEETWERKRRLFNELYAARRQ